MAVRVLVVDDDSLLLAGMVRVLHQYELRTAASTEAALRMLETEHFDAILTDLRVPTVNGIALLEQVAASHPEVRRYLMSGAEDAQLAAHLASKLVYRKFRKPFDVTALRDELGTLGASRAS
jgi:DNA-binding NtrC family response regulator